MNDKVKLIIAVVFLLIFVVLATKFTLNTNKIDVSPVEKYDTVMLNYPALIFTLKSASMIFRNDSKQEKLISYNSDHYITYRIDHLTREIFIEPSERGKKEFYDPRAHEMAVSIDRKYAVDGYRFFWYDTNRVCRPLRVVVHIDKQWENDVATNIDSIYTDDQLYLFLDNLKFDPTKLYPKFRYKDMVPPLSESGYDDSLTELSMKEYYTLFQHDYPYSYKVHPYRFLGYKKRAGYTQFFITHYMEAWGSFLYLIHIGNDGRRKFETIIAGSGGDGGDYFKYSDVSLDESIVKLTVESGYYGDEGLTSSYSVRRNCTYYFNLDGSLKRSEKVQEYQGVFPFSTYGPFDE